MFKNTGRCFVFQITLFSNKLGPALLDRSATEGIVFLKSRSGREQVLVVSPEHSGEILQTTLKNLH